MQITIRPGSARRLLCVGGMSTDDHELAIAIVRHHIVAGRFRARIGSHRFRREVARVRKRLAEDNSHHPGADAPHEPAERITLWTLGAAMDELIAQLRADAGDSDTPH